MSERRQRRKAHKRAEAEARKATQVLIPELVESPIIPGIPGFQTGTLGSIGRLIAAGTSPGAGSSSRPSGGGGANFSPGPPASANFSGGGGGVGGMAATIVLAFARVGVDPTIGIDIALCEAPGLNPNAIGDGGRSHGLFQLYDGGLLPDFYALGYNNPYDPQQSSEYSARHIAQNGVGPWSCADRAKGGSIVGSNSPDGAKLASGWSSLGLNRSSFISGMQEIGNAGEGGVGAAAAAAGALTAGLALGLVGENAQFQQEFGELVRQFDLGFGLDSSKFGLDVAEFGQDQFEFGVTSGLDRDIFELDQEISRGRLSLDQLIAAGELTLGRDAEDRLLELGRGGLSLDQLRTAIEASLGQQGINLDARGQDVTQRGQDITAGLGFQGLQLDQRAQDITLRLQDINAQLQTTSLRLQEAQSLRNHAISIGDLALRRDAEERLRAEQQQLMALQQYAAALASSQQQIDAQTSAASEFGDLASSFGNIELQRDLELARLAANPRDFVQLSIAQGGGTSFLDNLAAGRPIGAQGIGQIGEQGLLGAGFDQLVSSLNDRPDLAFFDRATSAIERLQGLGGNAPQAPTLEQLLQLGALGPVSNLPPPATPVDIQNPAFGAPPPVGLEPVTPPTIGAPGPFSALSPEQRVPAEQFHEAAPDVPIDIAIDVGRRPADFRQYFEGLTGGTTADAAPAPPPGPLGTGAGGNFVWDPELGYYVPREAPLSFDAGGAMFVNRPMVAVDIATGQPLFTASEYAPEKIEITPLGR